MTKCFEIEKVYTSDLLIAQVKHGVCLTLCYDFLYENIRVSFLETTDQGKMAKRESKYSNKFNFVESLPRSVKKIQAFSLHSLVEIWHFSRLALILYSNRK